VFTAAVGGDATLDVTVQGNLCLKKTTVLDTPVTITITVTVTAGKGKLDREPVDG